jgi:NAD(P)H-flavin reductase
MGAEVHAPVAAADPMRPLAARVRQSARETSDTFTLVLDPPAGEFRFAPGQFNMLYVFGVGEAPISISGDPGRPGELVHTIRAVGATTRAMQQLRSGDFLGVRGPFGTAWPIEHGHGRDVVIVAGGIGLAPLRPVVYHVLAQRERFGRVVLAYGARTPGDMLYTGELRRWRARFDMEVELTVDRGTAAWRASVGVVTKLVERAPFDPGHTLALLCGPEVMIRFAALALQKRGVASQDLHVSMERNMRCAIGLCGHCQFGPTFVCKDGPVFPFSKVEPLLGIREV